MTTRSQITLEIEAAILAATVAGALDPPDTDGWVKIGPVSRAAIMALVATVKDAQKAIDAERTGHIAARTLEDMPDRPKVPTASSPMIPPGESRFGITNNGTTPIYMERGTEKVRA